MGDLSEAIREYVEIGELERKLAARKAELRQTILAGLTALEARSCPSSFGTAERRTRYTLVPLREPVLRLLDAEDLFPFARFSAERVKTELVPKFGRERLVPLFDIQRSEYLFVKRPGASRNVDPPEDESSTDSTGASLA
jgi:hypothetical protein